MTVYEINKLISGFESILQNLQQQKETIFKFYSTEAFFELKLETVPEDNVIEMEIWINVGNQTNGRLYGYDEGIRFISEEKSIIQFLTDIRQEFADILQNQEGECDVYINCKDFNHELQDTFLEFIEEVQKKQGE